MKILGKLFGHWLMKKQIAAFLTVLLATPLGEAAALAQQSASPQQQSTPAQEQKNQDSNQGPLQVPTNDAAGTSADPPQSQPSAQPQAPGQNESPANSQSGSDQQQSGGAKPVGTAAAPYEKTTGVAASRPEGAVIAPAKQRRVRSFLIKVGIVVGAGVAVGTVVALSRSSPSRPN